MKSCLLPLMLTLVFLCTAWCAAEEDSEPVRKAKALVDIGQLKAAMSNLQFDCGSLPSDAQGLGALLADPGFKGWNGPYLKTLPSDPWKTAYRYKLTKDFYEIRSAGPDAKFDTADDI